MCIYIQKQSNNYVSVYIFNIFVTSLENSDGNHTEVLFIEWWSEILCFPWRIKKKLEIEKKKVFLNYEIITIELINQV
jgi:hypothetical protein